MAVQSTVGSLGHCLLGPFDILALRATDVPEGVGVGRRKLILKNKSQKRGIIQPVSSWRNWG